MLHHAVRDAEPDIHRMAYHLTDKRVTRETERDESHFDNLFNIGAEKIASGYVEKMTVIQRKHVKHT